MKKSLFNLCSGIWFTVNCLLIQSIFFENQFISSARAEENKSRTDVLKSGLQVNADSKDESKTSKSLAEVLKPLVDKHFLAGAVMCVADKDKILAKETVGFMDIAGKKEMKDDCLFWIASQSKPMTCAALMILVDEGKVKLDDPITKFLPEFNGMWVKVEEDKDHILLKRPTRAITIRDLCAHTSGLAFASKMEQPTLDALTLKDSVRSYTMTPLNYEPGTKHQYSNEGINAIGLVIQVVSGMPYEKFMATRIFEPLEMKDTTFWPNKLQIERLAKSYRPNQKKDDLVETQISQLTYPLDGHNRYPMPAGGLFSTADDVTHFCQMVLNKGTFRGKKILSERAVQEMTSRQTPHVGYGLGWSINGINCGHGGAYSTSMEIDRKTGRIYVYMVQHAGFPGDGGKGNGLFVNAAKQREKTK